MLIDICIKFREYSLSGFPGKNNMSPDPKGGRHNNKSTHFQKINPLSNNPGSAAVVSVYLKSMCTYWLKYRKFVSMGILYISKQ